MPRVFEDAARHHTRAPNTRPAVDSGIDPRRQIGMQRFYQCVESRIIAWRLVVGQESGSA